MSVYVHACMTDLLLWRTHKSKHSLFLWCVTAQRLRSLLLCGCYNSYHDGFPKEFKPRCCSIRPQMNDRTESFEQFTIDVLTQLSEQLQSKKGIWWWFSLLMSRLEFLFSLSIIKSIEEESCWCSTHSCWVKLDLLLWFSLTRLTLKVWTSWAHMLKYQYDEYSLMHAGHFCVFFYT